MKILVVDDSAFMRKAITGMIASDPSLTVVDTAKDGKEALEKAKQHKPDVITLDIEMPVMDGLTALTRIRAECTDPKPAILMCSSLTTKGSKEALAALRAGAADFIAKDASHFSLHINDIRDELIAKIKAIGAKVRGQKPPPGLPTGPAAKAIPRACPKLSAEDFDAVLIGSSTGGPPVLETIVTALPGEFPLPVVIAQHMPGLFTRSLAERLADESAVLVVHAENGMELQPGMVCIGEGGRHVRVTRVGKHLHTEVTERPADALYKPSVNELFFSGAKVLGARCLAIVCTGMGDDGKLGGAQLKAAGGMILSQEAESCVVYGMPKAVNEAGLPAATLTPDELAQSLKNMARGKAQAA